MPEPNTNAQKTLGAQLHQEAYDNILRLIKIADAILHDIGKVPWPDPGATILAVGIRETLREARASRNQFELFIDEHSV